uniref:60S acidic ribosomal protein P1 n=1 Tax=Fibrocapsa japonica TaxID=94617 RepID=A0A7S2V4N4_9STRA|mmetsp:Transcript_4098/g.6126  ORF Transcript_4098/g.6126 Transcript_4098/m.6126 type:complete len:123 (+) Transcript_4098:237-605(+)
MADTLGLTEEQKDEYVTSFAALALYDGEAEVTSEQINALITATGNTVEPYWPILFSKFLQDKLEDLVLSGGAGAGGAAGPAAGGAASGGDAGGAAEEEKKEEEEEEEIDMGAGDMFGGDSDY